MRPSPGLAPMLVLGLLGCGQGPADRPASRTRVNGVAATVEEGPALGEFCEVLAAPGSARPFTYPELGEGGSPPVGSWRWVNVWATWCKPCVEELPMMARWRSRLSSDGVEADLVFLSVDDSAATVAAFRESHTDVPADGVRMASPDLLGPWLSKLGLASGSVLPVHLFVDPSNRLRCVRMGGVSAEDYTVVKAILSQQP